MNRIFGRISILALGAVPAATAHGHGGEAHGVPSIWTRWVFEPGVIIPLVIAGGLYLAGVWRLWRKDRIGHGIRRWEAGCYAAGWGALVVALVSPLHPMGELLFSAHMTQHEVLMLVAAPLLVLGRPMLVYLKGLPPGWGRTIAGYGNSSLWQSVWRLISNPLGAWLIHAFVLWIWHLPSWFQATINDEFIHAVQHLSFLLSATLFWWSVMHGRQRVMGYGMAVLYMFTTAMHSGLLGALVTLAGTLIYPVYSTTTQSFGLTPLEDQQLGGLIMWVPAGLVYVIAGLAFVAGWMRESERRVRRWQTGADAITDSV